MTARKTRAGEILLGFFQLVRALTRPCRLREDAERERGLAVAIEADMLTTEPTGKIGINRIRGRKLKIEGKQREERTQREKNTSELGKDVNPRLIV